MYCAIGVEPTKPIALMSLSSRMASTTSLSPLTTLRMPAGSPASTNSSAMRIGTPGSRSDGFRMKALPQAIAGATFHSGIIAGKLNGVMPATTPSGWRIEIDVDAGTGAVGEFALHHMRRADADFDHFERRAGYRPWRRRWSCRVRGQAYRRADRIRVGQGRGIASARARAAADWSRPMRAARPWRSRPPRAVLPAKPAPRCRARCRPSAA